MPAPAIDLTGQRVLITHADRFMGPALCETFADCGAEVLADTDALLSPTYPAELLARVGRVDVLLAHLALPAPRTAAAEVDDDEWRTLFAAMVDPLPRLVRAVLPQMAERRRGKLLLMGSAAALRGQKQRSSYSAARGAQLSYFQALGIEQAPLGIQANAIAQNFVENPTYFPPEVQAMPAFQDRLQREVPLGRLVSAREDTLFAAYLCSAAADCFVGQVFPVSGGWALR